MRVSYNWIRELLPALAAPPEEVAARLSGAGLAVDGISRFGAALAEVRVARVTAIEPHPKRSNLRLVTVEHGAGSQQVVCGASNVPEPPGLVVLAPLGAKLPAFPEPLAPREIGGVKSEGMLASEAELGITESADGILVLPPGSAEPGQTLAEVVPGAVDWIFELDVTPNRPDALGHVGVARELAALYGLRFEQPPLGSPPAEPSAELASLVEVDNRDIERCPHYAAGAVLDVKVAPSPLWLRFRLESLGVRAISNVVDVTNLLLFEYGQPLHAFDLDNVRGGRIVVRRAGEAEPFTTLDGVERRLVADDLVIADGEGAVALAGVMGGKHSEIGEKTTRVLLECAYFAPRGVRRTSRRQGLHTESSHRFERGVDYGALPRVLERAKALLGELAGGRIVPGAIHARGAAASEPTITLRSARLDALLGVQVPFAEATAILERLGFSVVTHGTGSAATAEVRGVSFRPDVAREVDLIEEIARVRGFDQIPTSLPKALPRRPRRFGDLDREAALAALNLGLSEALTYAFVSAKDLENLKAPPVSVRVKNPLGEERSAMRTSLLPGLLGALAAARRHGEHAVRLFCVGATFHEPVREASDGYRPRLADDVGRLPVERLRFAALLAGPRREHLVPTPADVDVYDAKAVALEMVARLTGNEASVRSLGSDPRAAGLHPRGAADVLVGDVSVGRFGPLHPDVVLAFDLGGPALVVELDLEALGGLGKVVPRYRQVPRLPAVTRDLSLVVGAELFAERVASKLAEAAGELCESIEVVGDFRGGSVPEGRRSLTFRVVYRDPKARAGADDARTLTDQEVDAVEKRMMEAARTSLGVELRGE
jgi:phenylalanyl-tRNA synthetase beta chain